MILSTLIRTTALSLASMERALQHKSHMINIKEVHYNGFRKTFAFKEDKSVPVVIQDKPVSDDADNLLHAAKTFGAEILNNSLSIAGSKLINTKRYNLIVDGQEIGDFNLMELEVLHEVLSNQTLNYYYQSLPVRNSNIDWTLIDEDSYLLTSGPLPLIGDHCNFQFDKNATLSFDLSKSTQSGHMFHESELTLVEYEELSTGLSEGGKNAILERLVNIRKRVTELLDEARATSVEIAGNTGQKVFNFINTGFYQGLEYLPI